MAPPPDETAVVGRNRGSYTAVLFDGPSEDYPIIWQCDHEHPSKSAATRCWVEEARRRGMQHVEPIGMVG